MKEHNFKLGDRVRVVEMAISGDVVVGTIGFITAVLLYGGDVTVSVGEVGANFFYGNSGGKLELVYPNPPHKHHDLIIAWAKGAEIEAKNYFDKWEYVTVPTWRVGSTYRVKPSNIKSPKDLEVDRIEEEMRIISEKQLKLAEDLANLK